MLLRLRLSSGVAGVEIGRFEQVTVLGNREKPGLRENRPAFDDVGVSMRERTKMR